MKIKGSSKEKIDQGTLNVDPFVGSFNMRRDNMDIKGKFDYVLFDDSEAKTNDLIEGIRRRIGLEKE